MVSRTATTIEVDVGAGRIGVPTSSVLRIEEGRSALHEYEDRAGRVPAGDVEGWLALGEWASARGLGTQAREAYRRALSVAPDDPRANTALGNVQVGGRWVSEDEAYQAQGYVRFEGEWITPVEHEAILRERAADAEQERQRQQSESRVREAEARAEEAEARARQAEADAAEAQLASEGIPLWYGWGAGPGLADGTDRHPADCPAAAACRDERRERAIPFAAAALLAPTTIPAQTVDEIVARHVAARGGREALAAVRTLRMAGRANAGPGREAIVRREIARPGRIRTEFVFQGTTGVYAWNGSAGWCVSPLDGSLEPEPLPAEAAALSAEQADFEGPLVDWKAKGHAVELVGQRRAARRRRPRAEGHSEIGGGASLWVDAQTGLLVRTESTRKVRGHEVAFETVYGDYRETGGVRFARSIETGVRGRPRRPRILVENVQRTPRSKIPGSPCRADDCGSGGREDA